MAFLDLVQLVHHHFIIEDDLILHSFPVLQNSLVRNRARFFIGTSVFLQGTLCVASVFLVKQGRIIYFCFFARCAYFLENPKDLTHCLAGVDLFRLLVREENPILLQKRKEVVFDRVLVSALYDSGKHGPFFAVFEDAG